MELVKFRKSGLKAGEILYWVLWVEVKFVCLSREVENSEDFRGEKEFEDEEEKVAMMEMMKRFKNLKTIVTELKRRKTNCREIDYMLITEK